MYALTARVIIDHEPRVDSRLLAEQLGVEHRATRQLIQQYQSDFEEFGQLTFEMEVGERIQGGGNPIKFSLLNEDQSYLLLTYVQNTLQARELKKRLVRTFGAYRRDKIQPQSSFPAIRCGARLPVRQLDSSTVKSLDHIREVLDTDENLLNKKWLQPPPRTDCVALVTAIVDDIVHWRYPYPFVYGYTIAGTAYLMTRSDHLLEHLRNAPHFKDFFWRMYRSTSRVLEKELLVSGLIGMSRRGPVVDGIKLDWALHLPEIYRQQFGESMTALN